MIMAEIDATIKKRALSREMKGFIVYRRNLLVTRRCAKKRRYRRREVGLGQSKLKENSSVIQVIIKSAE